jgi:hypothetical protein
MHLEVLVTPDDFVTLSMAVDVLNTFKHREHSDWCVPPVGYWSWVECGDRYAALTGFEAVAIAEAYLRQHGGNLKMGDGA